MLRHLVLTVALATFVNAQNYQMKSPTLSLLLPSGLRMAIPDDPGISLVGVHYSVNKPLSGVAAGDWNYDITTPTGNEWVHENTQVVVNIGDTVYFWHLVIHNGQGYQKLEQSWTATAPTSSTTPQPTTPQPTTPRPTTPQPTTPQPTTSTTASSTTCASSTTSNPAPPPFDIYKESSRAKVYNAFKHKKYIKRGKRAPPAEACESYPCMIFEDNFDYLDLETWEHELTAGGGGNWEFQYYTNNRSNSFVKDGNLHIKPTLTADKYDESFLSSGILDIWGHQKATACTGNQWYGCMRVGSPSNYINPIQSARLRTSDSFNFRYGRVEIEARLPKGDWLWPAIWLLPRYDSYGGWPASGEIDMVESRGNENLRDEQGEFKGRQKAGATLHWGPFFGYNGYELTTGERSGDWADSFHKYILEWDDASLRLYFDNDLVMNVEPPAGGFWDIANWPLPDEANPWKDASRMAPFDQEFYIVLNVAVGGTNGFFPDSWTNSPAPKPWSNTSPTGPRDFWQGRNGWLPTWDAKDSAMEVNYVRVWKMKPDEDMELMKP